MLGAGCPVLSRHVTFTSNGMCIIGVAPDATSLCTRGTDRMAAQRCVCAAEHAGRRLVGERRGGLRGDAWGPVLQAWTDVLKMVEDAHCGMLRPDLLVA
mmetsp:Transcript_3827/g.11039  ORF Transcript_3827/g.11039 Transcript_3827/m.11039 type:complete len:99 (+) Transcript_3827:746-1042(+)